MPGKCFPWNRRAHHPTRRLFSQKGGPPLPYPGDPPFDLLRSVHQPGQHHLLTFSRGGAGEINAFVQRHRRTFCFEAPEAALGEAEEHGKTVMLQAGIDIGVQMEADDEGLRAVGFNRVFAEEFLPTGGEI